MGSGVLYAALCMHDTPVATSPIESQPHGLRTDVIGAKPLSFTRFVDASSFVNFLLSDFA
jgi:hypothetical protein